MPRRNPWKPHPFAPARQTREGLTSPVAGLIEDFVGFFQGAMPYCHAIRNRSPRRDRSQIREAGTGNQDS